MTGAVVINLAVVEACEERIVNAWPAVDTLLMDGWIVRFAYGYSGRANSASPLLRNTSLSEQTLAEIERLYALAGLPPRLRLTPLAHSAVTAMIEARGYRQQDASVGMIASLEAFNGAIPEELEIAQTAGPVWVRGVSSLQEGSKKDADDGLQAIVSRVRLQAGFATLRVQGDIAGYGMSVVDRGMAEIGSIVIDPRYRGKGHGRSLVRGLLDWAQASGARNAFLQVEYRNAVAMGLYRSLGFAEAYPYRTMVKD